MAKAKQEPKAPRTPAAPKAEEKKANGAKAHGDTIVNKAPRQEQRAEQAQEKPAYELTPFAATYRNLTGAWSTVKPYTVEDFLGLTGKVFSLMDGFGTVEIDAVDVQTPVVRFRDYGGLEAYVTKSDVVKEGSGLRFHTQDGILKGSLIVGLTTLEDENRVFVDYCKGSLKSTGIMLGSKVAGGIVGRALPFVGRALGTVGVLYGLASLGRTAYNAIRVDGHATLHLGQATADVGKDQAEAYRTLAEILKA